MNEMEVRKGSTQHKILAALAAHGQMTADQLKASARIISIAIDKLQTETLRALREAGLIETTLFGTWVITDKGLSVRLTLGSADISAPRRSLAARRADLYGRENYVPVELGRTCARPGAYDAFDLPSLMCGDRKYRRNN